MNVKRFKEFKKTINETLNLGEDLEIAKGLIGKTLIDDNTKDMIKVIGLGEAQDHLENSNDHAVEFNVIIDGNNTKILLGIESIMDLLNGKTAEKWGFPQLKIK